MGLTDGPWRCMICRRDRAYDEIDVVYRPMRGLEAQFPETRVNLAHCNDNVDCIATAHGPGPWPEETA